MAKQEMQRTVREVSEKWREESHFYRERVYENQRWLMASQLTISSGGIISLMNMDSIEPSSRFFAMLWFFGAIFSLVVYAHLQGSALSETYVEHSGTSDAFKRYERSGDYQELARAQGFAVESKASRYENIARPFYYFPFIGILIASVLVIEGLQ
ncbi:MAG: hypothetical protein AAGI28_16815 [Pseudomonadota bacterium]